MKDKEKIIEHLEKRIKWHFEYILKSKNKLIEEEYLTGEYQFYIETLNKLKNL